MTPFSQYKGWMAEGGIRNGLIVSGPVVKRTKGSINHGLMHVADIMPTLLEVAGTSYPKASQGRDLPPLIGKSWVPMLAGQTDSPRTKDDHLAWEVFGNRAVRQGDWKLRWQYKAVRQGRLGAVQSRGGSRRAKGPRPERPDKLKEMVVLWDQYVRTNNVILPSRTIFDTLEKDMPQRVTVYPGFPPLIYNKQFVPPKDMMADPKP